jgi:hypothetical protein
VAPEPAPPFAFSQNKATVRSTVTLSQGTQLIFSSNDLKDNETLILSRCGIPCDTAKTVREWHADELKPNSESATVLDAGSYYFWIQRRLPTGEVGPVFGKSSELLYRTTTVVHYTSGTTVTVSVTTPPN